MKGNVSRLTQATHEPEGSSPGGDVSPSSVPAPPAAHSQLAPVPPKGTGRGAVSQGPYPLPTDTGKGRNISSRVRVKDPEQGHWLSLSSAGSWPIPPV